MRLSLAGGQKKTALALLDADGQPVLRLPQAGDVLAIPRNGAPSSLILKPDNENLPGIVENEAYCLALARAVGIEAAQATIAPAGQRKALCVLRYDRRQSEQGRVQRIHQEDFAQANGVPPGRKYEHGTLAGPSVAQILATGHRLPPKDALALLDQVLFNILVANTDAHAKNYSILRPVGGGLHLAPLYDVSTVLAWDHVVQLLAQKIAGKRRKPADIAARHWDAIAADANYRPADRAAPPSVSRLLVKTTALLEKFDNIPPMLAREVMRSVLTGAPYPRTLLSAALVRLRAGDDPATGWHAAAIRAILAREHRLKHPDERNWLMSLEKDRDDPPYQLGRLFAALEIAQRQALGTVNATIRDRYYGAASATPAHVFPLLLRGAQNHLGKLRKDHKGGWIEREIEEIMAHLPPELPRSLRLDAQGRFAIGYYHQRKAQFAGRPASETDNEEGAGDDV